MVKWNSSPHPISDLRDWKETGRLEIRPDFQRLFVWSSNARIMLMDTILREIPMPKIFLANSIRDSHTYRVVIDGQQRIRAILDFLKDRFALEAPYAGPEKGKTFSQLDEETQRRFLSYQIDFNEAQNATKEETREVYSRVNKYTVPLTKQELRKADFPGDFLRVSEELAAHTFFEDAKVFTLANRRRYGDVEYVSELLAAMIDGIQDKKKTLDEFYKNFSQWEANAQEETRERFLHALRELRFIFGDELNISRTRFRQKADFYTVFLIICDFVALEKSVIGKNLALLREDLKLLQENIRPASEVTICSEYAIRCVSQANTASSRTWRRNFLKPIFAASYFEDPPNAQALKLFYRVKEDLQEALATSKFSSIPITCNVCGKEAAPHSGQCVLGWPKADGVYQVSNSVWIPYSCVSHQPDYLILEPPGDEAGNFL